MEKDCSMKLRVFTFSIILSCLAISLTACTPPGADQANTTSNSSPPAPNIGNKVNDIAPDFQLQDLDGNPVSLSDYRGSPVIVHFWRIN